MASSVLEEVQIGHQEEFLLCKGDEVLEEVAEGDGVVTIPGSVQGTTSHATQCYGLVVVVMFSQRLKVSDLGDLFQP